MNGLAGVLTLLSEPQDVPAWLPGAMDDARRLRTEMTAKMMAASQSRPLVMWPLAVAHLVVAGALLAAGIVGLKLKPVGRRALLIVFLAAIVFEIIRAAPDGAVARESAAVMEEYMPLIVKANNPGPRATADMDHITRATMKALGIAAVVMLIAMTLFKCAFYLIGALYLSKPRIVTLYSKTDDVAGGQGDWN
jgi:hypothetical protein